MSLFFILQKSSMMAWFAALRSLAVFDMARFARLKHKIQGYSNCVYRLVLSHAHPLLVHICYFISISCLGFIILRSLSLRRQPGPNGPRDIDLFFTSVSAATISSMSTVEMEAFSNSQLVLLTVLMFIGGEVLTSTVGLHLRPGRDELERTSSAVHVLPVDSGIRAQLALELSDLTRQLESGTLPPHPDHSAVTATAAAASADQLKSKAIRCLANVLKGYLLFIHTVGCISIVIYICSVSSAREILKQKDINVATFSVFTTVSSFSNCGFIPTNENMMVFKNNSGLLLLIIPQVLLGNTLFPSCLRFCVWTLRKFMKKKGDEYEYLLKNWKETGFYHLLPHRYSLMLVFTVFGLTAIQIIVICSMEWRSKALDGMNSYQKIIGALFLSVNSRHAGESVVDLSALSQAVLVLFVVMMYLPPYTAFIPTDDRRCISSTNTEGNRKRPVLVKSLVMSQLSYLAISVILICITEREKLTEDPLNFNVLSIVVEVISAYGNVGFSTGYSCARQLKPNGNCKDQWFGFVGKWSTKGKIILIVVMFYGRLKKFSMKSGKAWKLG